MSTAGPVFGKPPQRSIQTETSSNNLTPKATTSTSKRSAGEAKLKVVQYEIAEREAVKVIKTVCEEASNASNVTFNIDDIQDVMSGVLILGNLCRRICFDKQQVEERFTHRIHEFSDIDRKKDENIDQLEKVILKLQAENLRAGDHIAELNHKHNNKISFLTKEIHTLRDNLSDFRIENERLQGKIQTQEKKLMSMPRMEEQYMRNARSTIRQAELANTMNKIEWKKMEEELKNLQFYKNKAKQQSELVQRLRDEIDDLQQQNRTMLSQHQTMLRSMSAGILPKTAAALGGGNGNNSGSRPSSAPSTRVNNNKLPSSTVNTDISNSNTNRPANTNTKLTNLTSSSSRLSSAAQGQQTTTTVNRKSSSVTLFFPTTNRDQDEATEEIMKLRTELTHKEQTINKLAQRLSLARAYPLRSMQTTDIDDDEHGLTKAEAEKLRKLELARAKNKNNLLSGDLTGVDYMDDELGSVTSSFMAEEEALQAARFSNAITVQLEYNERVMARRAMDPPHVSAIRRSKSFAKVIEDLAKEEGEEYKFTA